MLKDQNGCSVLSRFQLGNNAQYLSLLSEGLTCDANGMATGEGRLILQRSDGSIISRTNKVWLRDGVPFNQPVQQASLAATNGTDKLWLSLGADAASQSYYFLRTELRNYRGIGVWYVDPQVDTLTANVEAFRDAAQIQAAISGALQALDARALPLTSHARLAFFDKYEEGMVKNQLNGALYTIDSSRRVDRRNQRAGDWQFSLNRGRNYVFERDQREAEEKRREEQRLAYEKQREEQRLAFEKRQALQRASYEAQRKLHAYETLVKAYEDPKSALANLQKDASFNLFGRSGYATMMKGRAVDVQLIVYVNGSDGGDAKANWPYDLRLVGHSSLEKNWYLVKGESTLDTRRRDSEGLPLTLVSATPDNITPCAEKGCTDLIEPLSAARRQFGEPDWTPEISQEIIEKAGQL